MHRLSQAAVARAMDGITAAMQDVAKAIASEENSYRNMWVASASTKGAGFAHQWTPQRVKAPPLPFMSCIMGRKSLPLMNKGTN